MSRARIPGRDERIAIAENLRLIDLLLKSGTPYAKELGVIVLERARAIAKGECEIEPADEDALAMLRRVGL